MLCADDFGFSKAISEAILELCAANRIQAVSVMVESPTLESYAVRLLQYQEHTQIGLHFNLTEDFGLPVYSLKSLMLWPLLGATPPSEIAQRLQSQLERFSSLFGRMPDFIDGHQHVHVFPAVRNILLRTLEYHYPDARARPWVRQVSAPLSHTDAKLKVIVLKLLNLGFRRLCCKHGFSYNQRFDGIYSLKLTPLYEPLLQAWLERATSDTLIMCHPATKDTAIHDAIANARLQEFKALRTLPG